MHTGAKKDFGIEGGEPSNSLREEITKHCGRKVSLRKLGQKVLEMFWASGGTVADETPGGKKGVEGLRRASSPDEQLRRGGVVQSEASETQRR